MLKRYKSSCALVKVQESIEEKKLCSSFLPSMKAERTKERKEKRSEVLPVYILFGSKSFFLVSCVCARALGEI